MKRSWIVAMAFLFVAVCSEAQPPSSKNKVFVDEKGVLRYTTGGKEASFFGVNYTVPFAYGYRSHKALGVDPEKAIDADVHHMARLGLNAFRVHVWDVEISDSLGNLLQNEHLRLFDYLVYKLKQRGINILVTPIAFWGNGYPEKDIPTNGFSSVYGKENSVVGEPPIRAQEMYLRQFFNHVNPYTKLTYTNDPDVIAMEINNEPKHSGPKTRATEYVSRMAAAVRGAGWTKPIFYNISESPRYADAVVKAPVDGHSFQWYPTGLVAGRTLEGNFLPHVDAYTILFGDTIAAFRNRAKMVYEFDAGDVMQPLMYPAMARSFRTAGFQWATQFAYDPVYTAYGNTEYQTHYLNLAYTPAKAISLLIAAKVFEKVPRLKSYGAFPADTAFEGFRLSYREGLSEMRDDDAFYYTGSTSTSPRRNSSLAHVAGVGSSPVVTYEGTGAYFLDKVGEGTWRLEVMPDAIPVSDPFAKASPRKEVTRIQWTTHVMQVRLENLGSSFSVRAVNEGNKHPASVTGNSFPVAPGVYLLQSAGAPAPGSAPLDPKMTQFYAPPSGKGPFLVHEPLAHVTAGSPFGIEVLAGGLDSNWRLSIEVRNTRNGWKTIPLFKTGGYRYAATIPAEMVVPGRLNYRIMMRNDNGEVKTFPGGHTGDPYAWDNYTNDSWQTGAALPGSPLRLFDATTSRNEVRVFNVDWNNNKITATATPTPGSLALRAELGAASATRVIGWQYHFKGNTRGRSEALRRSSQLVLKVRGTMGAKMDVALVDADANAYRSELLLAGNWQEVRLPLNMLRKSAYHLLPRPYPHFLPLLFATKGNKPLALHDAELLEILFYISSGEGFLEVEWVAVEN